MSGAFTESDLARADGGRFTDITLLGQGVTGIVFRAHDAQRPDGRWVAVKVSNEAGDPNTALLNEAAVVRHPTLSTYASEWPDQKGQPVLCQGYDDVYFAPRVGLVMEYLDPQVYIPLDKALEQGHETWTDYQILSILGPVVALLAQAHAAGYVYADISHGKAGHILWNPATRVVRSYDWGNVVDRRSAADSGAITDVADIVGCGEVLFAMREGPFARLPQNPASYRRPASPELAALVRRCLDRQAADCLKSAADLEQAMRAYVTAKDAEIARLGQQFDALSERFRATQDRAEQDRLARQLQGLREQVEGINPWSPTLAHMNSVHGRDLDTLKLQNTAYAAAEELRASVQGPQLDIQALEDVGGYLRSYDALLALDPPLPRPAGDRALIGLVAATLAREKPTVDAYVGAFVAGCAEDAPPYADLLDALLHGQPDLDHAPLRPLIAYLGDQAHVPLLRLETRRCVITLRDRDLAQLTTHLGQLGEGLEAARRTMQKQADDLARAVDAVEQALLNLQALGGQPAPRLSELPARYAALAQALVTLAALDSSGRDEARDLSQMAASYATTAEAAANAYAEGDFSQARQAVMQLKARDREYLALEQWARDVATLSALDLAALQKEFGPGSADSLPQRLRDYLGPQRLGKGLAIDPNHDFLRGQHALLNDVFLAIWADFAARGRDKPPIKAALADLLSRLVANLAPAFVADLPRALEGREAAEVRHFVGPNIARLAEVQQAASAATPDVDLGLAYQDFDEFASNVATAPRAATPLVKHMAPLLAPPMAASALELARRLFRERQWEKAQNVYNRISLLGDTDPGRAAAVQAEADYARKANDTLRRWRLQGGEGAVTDLSRLPDRPGVDARLRDTVKGVSLDLEDVLRQIREAGQALRVPLTNWEDFFNRLDACLGLLDEAGQREEKVSLLPARFVGQGLRELGTFLGKYNILLTAVPSGGRWVQRTRDPHLHKLKEDLTGSFWRPPHHGAFEPVYQGLGVAAKDAVQRKSQPVPAVAVVVASEAVAGAPTLVTPAEGSAPPAPNPTPLRTGVRPPAGGDPPTPPPPGGAGGGRGASRWDRTSMAFAASAVVVIALFAVGMGSWAMRARSASEGTAPPTSVVAGVEAITAVPGILPPSIGITPSSLAPTPIIPALVSSVALTGQPTVAAPNPSPAATPAAPTAPPTAATSVPGTLTAAVARTVPPTAIASAGPTATSTPTLQASKVVDGRTFDLCAESAAMIHGGGVVLLCSLEEKPPAQDGPTSSRSYQMQTPPGQLDYGFVVRFASPHNRELMLIYLQQDKSGSVKALVERIQSPTIPENRDQLGQALQDGKPERRFGPTDVGKGGAPPMLRLDIAPDAAPQKTKFALHVGEKTVTDNWLLDDRWKPVVVGLFARNEQDIELRVPAWVESK